MNIHSRFFYPALELIPHSDRLWKETANLESSATDGRIPLSVELWLALAHLECAKAVLNKARKAVPTSHEIWIAAGCLLEQARLPTKTPVERAKELNVVDTTVEAGVRELIMRRHQALLTREQRLNEAERCERDRKSVV